MASVIALKAVRRFLLPVFQEILNDCNYRNSWTNAQQTKQLERPWKTSLVKSDSFITFCCSCSAYIVLKNIYFWTPLMR